MERDEKRGSAHWGCIWRSTNHLPIPTYPWHSLISYICKELLCHSSAYLRKRLHVDIGRILIHLEVCLTQPRLPGRYFVRQCLICTPRKAGAVEDGMDGMIRCEWGIVLRCARQLLFSPTCLLCDWSRKMAALLGDKHHLHLLQFLSLVLRPGPL